MFILLFFLTGIWLLYSVAALITTVQWSKSAIRIHISPPSWISSQHLPAHPSRPSRAPSWVPCAGQQVPPRDIYRCFWTVVLEKILESLLECKEIKPINPRGNQPWIFIRRTDAKTEAPILWPPDVKSRLTRKDPDARRDWGQEENGATEDEMLGWHHQLNGHEFEQTPGDGEVQGNLACCSPWGLKESDTTEQLNNSNKCYL